MFANEAPELMQQGVPLWIPADYPLANDNNLLRMIFVQQRIAASVVGIPEGLVSLQHHKQYAQMARVVHVETVLRSRFNTPPRGLVTALEGIASSYLEISVNAVQRLRKWISACNQGKRESIAKLRVNAK